MCQWDPLASSGTMPRMLGMRGLPSTDPQGLPPEVAALIAQLQQQVQHQAQQLSERDQALAQRDALLQRKDREIALRDAKIEKINFELARLKRWTYGAKSEVMNADQRRLFEETLVEDEAALREQLERLRREAEAAAVAAGAKPKAPSRKPRRNPLPGHLRRVEHRHEPEHTDCQEKGCGRPMQRIGEDITERLDIVPAEFFVPRHSQFPHDEYVQRRIQFSRNFVCDGHPSPRQTQNKYVRLVFVSGQILSQYVAGFGPIAKKHNIPRNSGAIKILDDNNDIPRVE